jgi:hypothetical protein
VLQGLPPKQRRGELHVFRLNYSIDPSLLCCQRLHGQIAILTLEALHAVHASMFNHHRAEACAPRSTPVRASQRAAAADASAKILQDADSSSDEADDQSADGDEGTGSCIRVQSAGNADLSDGGGEEEEGGGDGDPEGVEGGVAEESEEDSGDGDGVDDEEEEEAEGSGDGGGGENGGVDDEEEEEEEEDVEGSGEGGGAVYDTDEDSSIAE